MCVQFEFRTQTNLRLSEPEIIKISELKMCSSSSVDREILSKLPTLLRYKLQNG